MNFAFLRCTRSTLSLATTVAMAVSAMQAVADESIEEEIVVTGKYLSMDKINSVKTPTPILDVPQSLSILTEAQIEEQAFRNFGDVLRYTPGLSISQGEGHRDAIIIRGIESTADFFIDGIRDDVQYFRPLYNVQQIEILRGSNALLFGRGGGGGVINRVQKKAVIGDRFNSIDADYDSLNAYAFALDSNTTVGERGAFRLNGYYHSQDNHRDFFDGDSYAVNPTFRAQLGESTTLDVSYEYVDDDRVVDRGVPSVVRASGPDEPLENFEETFFGSANANRTTLQANIVRARLDHVFSEQLRGNVSAHYADYDKMYQNLYASEAVVLVDGRPADVELDGYRDTTERENFIVQANLIGEFDTGSVKHTLLFGAEFGNQQTDNARVDNVFAANGDDQLVFGFSDPLMIPEFAFSDPARDRSSELDFVSVYLQDQIDLTPHIKVLAGLRYDSFDIDVLDVMEQNDGDAVDGRFSRKDTEVTPRYGIIWKPVPSMSVYASYSETFLPRSGDQFLTLNLDSESTRPQFFENREVGFKWDIRADLSFTMAAFELERESFTSVDPENPELVNVIEGSETTGFELQLQGNMTEFWAMTVSYSRLDGEVQRADGSGDDGNVTRQTPDNMFSIWNNFQLSDRLSIGLGATYQDSFFVREDNAVEVPDYTRVDAAVFYDVSQNLRLQLNIENLRDEEYFPDAHSNTNISTGKPLNARLSATYRF